MDPSDFLTRLLVAAIIELAKHAATALRHRFPRSQSQKLCRD